jgi:hypothetical protein
MAKATKGKRTASKAGLKRAPAGRKSMKARSDEAFPGGSVKTRREVKQVVPRMRRQTVP